MKHADAAALAALCDLIENLRRRSVLVEKRLGIFYIKG
jgi:ABC-type transporter Mla MlaB component